MTTPHRTLQMALDALDAITDDVDGTGLDTMPSFDKAIDAIAALREALAAPEPEPVARCILDNGDEMGSVEWLVRPRSIRLDHGSLLYAAPPAAPEPSVDDMPGMWEPSDTFGGEADSAAPPAAPAPAQPVPLTQDQIADCTRTAHRACNAKGPMTRWSTEFARAIEAAHGITGGSHE